jgi:hypothetical protein
VLLALAPPPPPPPGGRERERVSLPGPKAPPPPARLPEGGIFGGCVSQSPGSHTLRARPRGTPRESRVSGEVQRRLAGSAGHSGTATGPTGARGRGGGGGALFPHRTLHTHSGSFPSIISCHYAKHGRTNHKNASTRCVCKVGPSRAPLRVLRPASQSLGASPLTVVSSSEAMTSSSCSAV